MIGASSAHPQSAISIRIEKMCSRTSPAPPSLRLLLVLVLSVVYFHNVPQAAARTAASLKVRLPHGGTLIGRHLTTIKGRAMRAFMGVPYAKPPLGELRFKAPVPYGSWTGELQAIRNSAKCTQRDPYRRDLVMEGSEDCLYLNVYTPQVNDAGKSGDKKRPLPTMVWFHGGGWQCGSGISDFYGPDFLLDHDVVLVSANFRLGPLGFLSTETTDCPGNFGFKDQLEVLKWIQENIASFGGDPNSVTMFGESAGGASVTYHMLSEKSKGLFHKGIAQSGTYFNPWAQPAHKGVPAQRTRKLAQLVHCDSTAAWPQLLACLREKSADDIVATIYDFFEWDYDPMIPFPPVVEPPHEGSFLCEQPRTTDVSPHGFSLPLMIGSTSDEGLLKTAAVLNDAHLLDELKQKFKKVIPIVLNYDHHTKESQKIITESLEQFYFKEGHSYDKIRHHNLTDLISDGWFVAGIDEYLRLRLKGSEGLPPSTAPTFVYLFQHKGAASFTEIFQGGRETHYGTCHAEELQYLFPVARELFVTAVPTEADLQLRELMLQLWVNFARHSHPTPSSSTTTTTTATSTPIVPAIKWLPSTTYPVSYMHIGSQSGNGNEPLLKPAYELYQNRVDFWNELMPYASSLRSRIVDEL